MVPEVSRDVLSVDTVADDYVAHAKTSGEFPGSPVVLTFLFSFSDDERVASLAIRS